MFKHFVGKIYILDEPPQEEKTQLGIPFPDQILGDLDEKKFDKELTREQVAKIILYHKEMTDILGAEVYERIRADNIFQTSDAELIKKIAYDMASNPNDWNGLGFLNSTNTSHWDRMLYKIIYLQPGGWESEFKTLVAFVKILKGNWFKSIPQLLTELAPYDVAVDDFFKLERKVTFKLSSLLSDVNILQKEILKDKGYDISRFVFHTSHAFLPPVVYELEEFGLPRMISKKIHSANLINFYDKDLNIYNTIQAFHDLGIEKICASIEFSDFDEYILKYFYEGITVEQLRENGA